MAILRAFGETLVWLSKIAGLVGRGYVGLWGDFLCVINYIIDYQFVLIYDIITFRRISRMINCCISTVN